jgi:hypothetical protein
MNDKIHDIRKRHVTIRSEIWTTNIRSPRFQDIRASDIMEVDITKFRVYFFFWGGGCARFNSFEKWIWIFPYCLWVSI